MNKNSPNDFFYRKAIRKTRNGCSVCNDHRWRKQTGMNRKILKQEDDDHVWNEVTKLRRENGRLTNEKYVDFIRIKRKNFFVYLV